MLKPILFLIIGMLIIAYYKYKEIKWVKKRILPIEQY
jgi:hypothetical protein